MVATTPHRDETAALIEALRRELHALRERVGHLERENADIKEEMRAHGIAGRVIRK